MKYNTTYITALLSDAKEFLSDKLDSLVHKEVYGIAYVKDWNDYNKLYMYKFALENWNQHSNGEHSDLDNCMSENEMNSLISNIKLLGVNECDLTNDDSDTLYLEFSQENGDYILP